MEAPDHSGPMDSFQMAIEDDLCLDLLSAQADMDLLSAQAEMDLLSAQAEMDLLSSQANMDLLPVQTGMNPLPVQTGMDILSCTELLGPEGHCVEQQAIGESTTLLTQSERERQKTQDSLSILGDPDSLELSKAQVEEFYNRTFPEPSSPSTGLSQGLAEATGADPMRDRLEVAEATQSVSGIGMLDAGEEQMDIAHKDSTAPTQYEEMLVSCNVDVNVPSLIKLEGSYFDNSPEKEGAFSDHVLMLQGEEGPGTVDTRPEGAIMISDVSPIPVNEADTLEERGEDLPVGGSVSPQSSNAKSVTSVEESCAETVVTIDGTTVTKDVEMTTKCGRGQRQRHEEVTETTPTVSNKADQQSDNSDASRGLRRSSRSSLRKPQYTTPHIDDPPPSRLITCRHPSQSSPAQRYTQKSWPPPPQPSGLPRQPPRILCATCQGTLQSGQTAYQRKGMPQLFCSSGCLAVFSRKPPRKKPCAFCKQDMGVSKAPLIAQVGQTFQEFCSNTCHSKYEARLEIGPIQEPSSPTRRCSVCNSTREMVHEVSSGNIVHLLCSDVCFTRFRATKGLKTSCCDACGTYINMSACRAEYLLHEGQQKRFCNSSCLRLYKMKNTKVLSCQWCKTLCKNFDMLSKVDDYGKTRLFCSVCCIASHKVKTSDDAVPAEPCSSCRRTLLEPAYYCKANETVYMFCSPGCWTKFQSNSPNGDIHLNCHSCHNMFSGKPEIFEWQDSIYQFCSKECCEDYKRLNGVVSMCEHCKEEKLLHERIKFSGVEKAFCSDGCILLYKQDFTKQLGLCCINCTYCSQTCMRAVTEELDGNTWDFCSEDCKSKYLLWYLKVTRCHACKRQGKLLETIHWRGEIKHYCNQQCLLRFYSQQNQPNLATQQGPESLLHSHSPDSKSPPAATKKSEATGKMKSVATPAPSLPPTSQKNKSSMCKPMMTTTGVSCKPEMRSQGCQTDDYLQSPPLVLPVPVPVFLPLPLQMYCQYTPVTMALPLPLPVPMFLPITLEHVDKMVETIKELKLNIPDDPVESDILAMAALIAEADAKISSDLCGVHMKRTADQDTGPSLADCILAESNDMPCMAESGDDSQDELIKAPLDLNPSVDFLLDCGIVEPHPILAEQSPNMAAHKGPKRLAMSETTLHDPLDCLPVRAGLNSSYGVKAWRSWVQSKHSQSEDGQQKQMEMKEDLLLYGAVELNHGLTQFVKDILSPRGPCYKPDSIFYLCLGIQQYLLENNRMVNIFTDQLYFTFAQELNNIVSKWQPTMSPHGGSESCVLEEHLWECKQLGVYSPFVLLNTLMFFNTKYFGLWTVEQHLQLSFANVTIKAKRTSTPHGIVKSTGVCYQPKSHHKRTSKESSLGKRKRDEPPELEQQENSLNPLRCPVKFFEFYLSKCSNRVRSSCTAFYLQPESTCMADSRLWYSDVPMDRGMMGIMLNRILAVKDIYEGHAGQGDMD